MSFTDTTTQAMTFFSVILTVMVGALVSLVSTGGFGSGPGPGVGVGSTGSFPPQDTKTKATRREAVRDLKIFRIQSRVLSQCIYPRSSKDYPAWETWEMGIRKPAPSERTAFMCLSPDDSRTDLPEYPYPA